jgi:hypothetical protein
MPPTTKRHFVATNAIVQQKLMKRVQRHYFFPLRESTSTVMTRSCWCRLTANALGIVDRSAVQPIVDGKRGAFEG